MTPMTRAEYLELLTVERFFTPPPVAEPMPAVDHELLTQRRKRALHEADREYQQRHLRSTDTKETA